MYLVESIFERPFCGCFAIDTYISIFFSMIGKNLSNLLDIDGVEKKIEELLNEKKNQPDAIFSPDLPVRKGAKQFWVEFKMMQKVSDYSEDERLNGKKDQLNFLL